VGRGDMEPLSLWRLVTVFMQQDALLFLLATPHKNTPPTLNNGAPNRASWHTHCFLCNTKGPKMISVLMIPVLCHATRYSWNYSRLSIFNQKIVKFKVCMPNHYCRCWSSPMFC
jgi:hypothetical protein